MDSNLLTTAVLIGATLLILIGVGVMMKRATVRALVWWIGLACLPVGALLSGMVPYLIDAWNGLALWFQKSTVAPIPAGVVAGLVVVGVGLALLLLSRVIPFRKRAKPTPKTPAPRTSATPSKPAYGSQPTPTDRLP